MTRMPTDYAIVMVRKARERGCDLLAGLGFSLTDLERSERMSVADYARVLERFGELHPEADFGFRLGELFSMANHGAAGFGAMSAPTIRDGLVFLSRYIQTRTPYTSCRFSYRRFDLQLHFELGEIALPFMRRSCETLSVIFQSYLESAGASAEETRWHFPYARPAHHACYGRWLRGAHAFDAAQLRLEVPEAICALPSAFRNDAAFASTTSQCEAILADAAADGVAARVRAMLASRIEQRAREAVPVTQIPSADGVAAQLGVSRRTLIRQLKDAGTTFQALKDELRREQMEALLRDGQLPLAEIAERLGYAEAANLTRACTRLLGEAPQRLRARQRTAGFVRTPVN
ncbi:MAG TPA: AraC family transcriptional regulator ligand-binding domain-containing protein [Myxococcota bacterium]|nr:AraC family transcriptional regulator ligand-binding domain-containing protein [Myxococcota bacterium]